MPQLVMNKSNIYSLRLVTIVMNRSQVEHLYLLISVIIISLYLAINALDRRA